VSRTRPSTNAAVRPKRDEQVLVVSGKSFTQSWSFNDRYNRTQKAEQRSAFCGPS